MYTEIKEKLSRNDWINFEVVMEQLSTLEDALISDVIAVVKRNDTSLGRPLEDCEQDNMNETTYVVVKPSRLSVVCSRDLGRKNINLDSNTEWQIITVDSLLTGVLTGDFTHLQILFTADSLYSTADFEYIKDTVKSLLATSHEMQTLIFRRMVSMVLNIRDKLNTVRFTDEQMRNRLFLIKKVLSILMDYVNTGEDFNFKAYNPYISIDNVMDKIIVYQNEHFQEQSKQDRELKQLEYKFEIMNKLVDV